MKNTLWARKTYRILYIIAIVIGSFTATSQNLLAAETKKEIIPDSSFMFQKFQNDVTVRQVGLKSFDLNDNSVLVELLRGDWHWQNSLAFLVPPTVSSISPSSPQTSTSDQNVVVNGSNFVSGLTVTVTFPSGGTGTLSGSQLQNVTSSSFTMRITLNATGTWRIRVNNPNGEQSALFSFNVTAAQTPTISSISPSSPTVSNSNQNVQVSGSNFQNGMTVTVFFPGGGSGTLSGTQLQNITQTSFRMVVTLNLVGTYSIRINNPSGLQSSTFNFQVQAATPSISSISPSGVCAQNGDRNFTVSGSSFVSGLTVTVSFPGGGSTTLSGSQIQNVTSTSFTMTVTLNIVGTYNFRVNNPSGAQSSQFSYATQNCNPNISSINPSSPTVSNNDQTIAVSGSNFQSGLTVTIFFPGGGSGTLQGSQIQFNSSSSFNMIVTLNVVGQYQIRVNDPNGTTSPNFSFSTQASAPSISSISPSSPCIRNIDQSVTVNGSNFVNGLTVSVAFPGGGTGTLSGSQIQNVTATSFTVIITLADPGSYAIRVINPGGSQSNSFNFTPQNCLSVLGINPSSPIQSNVNQDVTVNGSGFAANLTVIITLPDNTTVTLSGAQILNVNTTSFTMRITLNAIGQWRIKVRNPNGDLSNIFTFTVQAPAPPTIASINPASPTASNVDQNVTINGSNFQAGLTVAVTFPNGGTATLSGTQIQNVTVASFTMRVTFNSAGTWCIRINNPNGGQSSTFCFTVQSGIQSATIFSINPATPIVRNTDQDVIVSGSNFQQNLTVAVTFPGGGGTTLSGAQIQNVSATSFIVRVTLNAAGNWTIRVVNPDNGQSNVFGFSVSSGGNNPVINSINPPSPITNGADQNVIVNGSNFQNNLRVNVTFPNGGMATLQGTGQIQNVTANSFLMRITLNAAGSWTIRVINPDNSQSQQFAFNVQPSGPPPTGLPTSVLSPVIGSLRVTTSNQAISDGKWEFNQYGTGNHTPTGGISLSNDRYAWDINLYTPTSGNADAGKPVFAVANGEVVSYVGTTPGGGPGAVLIAHPNAANPVWFSGYQHMANVRVTFNEQVNAATVIGEIGRIGANDDHLHFVVYSGQNTRGNLISFNTIIAERSSNATNPPTISSIVPSQVTQSTERQLITINGTDFQPNSIIEIQDPNGRNFTITPEPVSIVETAKILDVTSTTITARVPFAFDGTYTVTIINRPNANLTDAYTGTSSFALSSNYEVISAPGFLHDTPVVLIPGVMGSRLGKKIIGDIYDEIFPSTPYNAKHQYLKTDIGFGNPIGDRPIVATDIFRDYFGGLGGRANFYGTLIDTLTDSYSGYRLYRVTKPRQRTLEGCDANQRSANFFIFPYDWRSSNEQSAKDLKGFIDCIKSLRDPQNTNPNFKVNVIAHSQGGLVARRYILEGLYGTSQNYDPKIKTLITLGTPWLGAPKFINVLETGEHESLNRLMSQAFVRDIARYMPGPQELIPSRAYTNELRDTTPGDFPFGEDGWDFNGRDGIERIYNFTALERSMNRFNPPNTNILPGTNTDVFHNRRYLNNRPLQDNWTGDQTGITYYNFIGQCLNNHAYNTVGSVVAKSEWYQNVLGIWREKRYLETKMTRGDCTVPEISSMRESNLGNYRGPAIPKIFLNVDHGGLPNSLRVIDCIRRLFIGGNLNSCSNAAQDFDTPKNAASTVNESVYSLSIIGSPTISISDSFGNTTSPFSTSTDEGVATVSTNVTGDDFLHALIPLDQNYKVTFRTAISPLAIRITKNEAQHTTLAIRYLDLNIPPDVLAQLEITPQGVSVLRYDSDGDGTFDTPVNPTITVTGTPAQDVEPPQVNVNETVQSGTSRIDLEATDAGTGVQRIMYSLNGTTFQQYSTPLLLNPAQTPTIYVFADDNVFNRSGLVTHNLTTSNTGFIVSSPTTAPTGSQITVNWNAPSGRPVDDWIGLFRAGTLNSAYISKQYTEGTTSGNLNFLLPNQPGLYEFRYLLNDGFTSVAISSPISVSSNRRSPFDFDGDDKTDISIFRPSNGQWWINRSLTGQTVAAQFGNSADKITPGDFTGDGKTDIAFWRPSSGQWFVLRSEDASFYAFPFGANGDIPMPADYDGDGKTDPAVFRPSSAVWYILRSGDGGVTIQQFGASGDKPVAAEYDGDGKADISIIRSGAGGLEWWYQRSSNGQVTALQFGESSDKAVPGDYTGDGKADVAFWRPSNGFWYILRSENSSFYSFPFGSSGDVPSPGDYDGDGRFDAAVFRPSDSGWYILRSTSGVLIRNFGLTGDLPVPNAFVP